MNHGLIERDTFLLDSAFRKFPEIDAVILFGSRALETHKHGSDVDLCLVGSEISRETIIRLSGLLNEELPLPYFFDILDFKSIVSKELKEHIREFGKTLWEKS